LGIAVCYERVKLETWFISREYFFLYACEPSSSISALSDSGASAAHDSLWVAHDRDAVVRACALLVYVQNNLEVASPERIPCG